MTTMGVESGRRLYRDRDRAVLGGVCAGLAGHFGFNLKVTRLLAVIAFLMTMPVTIIAYLAAVFLIPSESGHYHEDKASSKVDRCCGRRRQRRKRKEADSTEVLKSTIAADINRRCESMDERLARLEKHVTSKRFQIEQELSRL